MSAVREMRGIFADQMVTRDQFERYNVAYSNLVFTTANDVVAPIKQELKDLQVHTATL